MRCLKENGPHRLIHLNALTLVSGIVWGGLEGVASLEEVWPCWRSCAIEGQALRFQKPTRGPVCPACCLWLIRLYVSSQLLLQLLHHACLPPWSLPRWSCTDSLKLKASLNEILSLISYFGHGASSQWLRCLRITLIPFHYCVYWTKDILSRIYH